MTENLLNQFNNEIDIPVGIELQELRRELVRLHIESEINKWSLMIHKNWHRDAGRAWTDRKIETILEAKGNALARLEGNEDADSIRRGFDGSLKAITKDIKELS